MSKKSIEALIFGSELVIEVGSFFRRPVGKPPLEKNS